MAKPTIDSEECSACGICVDACPNGTLELGDDSVRIVSEDNCDGCGTCAEECPMSCIEVSGE